MLKTIGELNLGFSDASNYIQRGNKQMLSSIFVKNSYLEDLLKPSVYFLLGEKGTGKTAYAAYLNNAEYKGFKSILKFITGTDYEKFYGLKKGQQIDISGYVDTWKAILLVLIAKSIDKKDIGFSIHRKNTLDELLKAIDEYYNNGFSPEIITALKITDNSERVAKLVCKYAEAGGTEGKITEFTEQRMQLNLLYIAKRFSECFNKLKLNKNIILFIDGIDIRSSRIPYNDYLECIQGLTDACWSLNTDLFANVKDSKGRIKIVLLLRPDIFNSLSIQNATNKLTDNSVFLEWRTTYLTYTTSYLYQMANKLLSYDQSEQRIANLWDTYFDWKIPSPNQTREYDTAFIEFLKISLSRPRDIHRILMLQQELMKREGLSEEHTFSYNIYKSNEFQNRYSEYFLSSLKDQLAFYYSDTEFKYLKKFFELIPGRSFTYSEYIEAFDRYIDYICDSTTDFPQFMEGPKEFLQFLYDCNMIVAIEELGENDRTFHFSYREKSSTNITPEVPIDENISYRFHYGLYKQTKKGRY